MRTDPLIYCSNQNAAESVRVLTRRMEEFYTSTAGYYESAEQTASDEFFVPLLSLIRNKAVGKPAGAKLKLLELGAGRSRLPEFLRRTFSSAVIEIFAHDIVDKNRDFLERSGADTSLLALPIESLPGAEFDIIVSFFVYEHVSRPAQFIDEIERILLPGGDAVFVCPKYIAPLYVPPALRWMPPSLKGRTHLRLLLACLVRRITGRSNFIVVAEPSVFHRPWKRDYDAVHMVDPEDLKRRWRRRFAFSRWPLSRVGFRAAFAALTLMTLRAHKLPT